MNGSGNVSASSNNGKAPMMLKSRGLTGLLALWLEDFCNVDSPPYVISEKYFIGVIG